MKKTLIALCVVLMVFSGVVFAGGGREREAESLRVAGVMMHADVEWFRYIDAGMRRAAEEEGVDYVTGNADMDVVTEGNLVDLYTAQGFDAIIISALDSAASVPALNRARQEGVAVINYNTNPPGSEYFIGIDNYTLGYQMGEYLADYIASNNISNPRIAMVTISMFEVGQLRADGFLDAIQGVPGVEIVAQQDAAGPERGADVVETIIQGDDNIDFIWAANEGGMIGAVVGVMSAGMADQIKVFGTDMSLQAAQYLLDEGNPLYAISTQQPFQIGYESMKTAVRVVRGESADSEVIVPLDFYSREDLARVREYLDEAAAIVN